MNLRLRYLLLLAMLFLPLIVSALTVSEVRIENRGVGRLDEESVKAFLSTRAGEEFDRGGVSRDVKLLQKTGRFTYVEAEAEPQGKDRVVVVFGLYNKSLLRRLTISGAEELGNVKVRNLLDMKVGDPVDEATVGARASVVRAEYRKKYFPDAVSNVRGIGYRWIMY